MENLLARLFITLFNLVTAIFTSFYSEKIALEILNYFLNVMLLARVRDAVWTEVFLYLNLVLFLLHHGYF